MPGNATMAEAAGQPQINTDADFTMLLVGASTLNPVTAGQVTSTYTSPAAAVTDLGAGDAVDALTQAIKVTPGNPAPPPAVFYHTPSTTPGSYGTINVAGVLGTAVPANNTAITPKGTYEPWMQIVTGFTVGATGGTAYASLNNGREKRLVNIGTSTVYNFPASDGWGPGSQAGFQFNPAAATKTALYTKTTLLQTTLTGAGHFTIVSGGTPVHAAADTAGDTALAAIPAATTDATCVTLFNACKQYLGVHGASAVFHAGADAALATALAAIPTAVTVADVDLYLDDLIAAYSAHRVNVTSVHGSADGTNTITAYVPIPGALLAGDTLYTTTTPPMFATADLYAAGPPATGMFAAIAESSTQVGIIVITEPVSASDYSILVAGLNYGLTFDKRWSLIVRFRDPTSGETDAAYILAFQAFRAACPDNRITPLAGSCWVTDAFTGRVYLRSFIGPYLARLQSFAAVAGARGEKLAQNPGWVTRGPLEGASLKDSNGNTIGHDELIRGGIDAANGAPTGGGVCLCYRHNSQVQGTYVSNRSTVLYPVLSTILTPMDRRVANALEQAAVGVSLTAIGEADVWDPVTLELDEDIRNGLASKISQVIRDNYSLEFQNALDPGLVVINPTVTVSGAQVTITGVLNVRFYGYTDTVALTFAATR